jgi:hypothetical protein
MSHAAAAEKEASWVVGWKPSQDGGYAALCCTNCAPPQPNVNRPSRRPAPLRSIAVTTPPNGIEILAEAQEWAYRRAAELDRAGSTVRIRKKAGPNLGNQYYSHAHRAKFAGGYRDPMAETLCGADATSYDMSAEELLASNNRSISSDLGYGVPDSVFVEAQLA